MACLAVLALVPATVAASPAIADPGTPGIPAAPRIVFSEEFENGQGATPILVTGYTGPAPVNATYTADPAWLTACNGIIASQSNPAAPPPIGVPCAGFWGSVRQLAGVLGQWAGNDPATNHAVTAYTNGASPGANKVQLETVNPIDIGAASRFITFSVDAASVNCFTNHAKLGFYLLDGATVIPTFSSPIDPCDNPGTVVSGIAVGTYTSDAPVLFNGSQVGIRLVNLQPSGIGNDAAFDNVRILDVTPQLDVGYSPGSTEVGQSAKLILTVTNTSDLREKNGWSFKVALPDGLKVAAGAPVTTCAAPAVTAPAGGGTVTVAGGLAAGATSCTVEVKVTASSAGEYTTCAQDVSQRVGINAPGCASVTFVPPILSFDAHAHGGKVHAPLINIGPLAPSDLSCTVTPGSDDATIAGATLSTLGSLGIITTEASGVTGPAGLRTAKARATTADLSLLGGLVTAKEIKAEAAATEDSTGAVTTTGSVHLTQLKVNGATITNPTVNQTINIPLVARIVINERTPYGAGKGIAVNAIHITTVAGIDIIVSHAHASLTTPGQPCPTP